MNWYLFFYLISIADNLKIGSVIGGVIVCIAFIVFLVYYINLCDDAYDDFLGKDKKAQKSKKQQVKNKLRYIVIVAALFSAVAIFVPSKKDILLIVGGGAAMEFIENDEHLKELPSEVTEFITNEMKELNERD